MIHSCTKSGLSCTKSGLAGLALLGLSVTPLCADPMVPTVIVDADSGEVLHAEEATRPWFPASTTKLMTAYVALRSIRSGQIKPDTPIVVSTTAARQPPSKIGLKPGQEITLENALKIIMVKSANDVSTVIAEGVGGSVSGFSAMMNREATRLGMRESHFVNPHGLHSPEHVSSARDMAILARALIVEFPEYRDLWGIGAVQLGNRRYMNTNGLIGRYSGAMGMKTGFVCASGFNLVSAAERSGRTLIAVVFGATSGADRTLKAAQLLDQGFSGGGFSLFSGTRGGGRTLHQLTASVERSAPNRRAEICGRRGPPASEEDSGAALAFTNDNPDRPSALIATGRTQESFSVGQRVGNHIVLGQRAIFEPVVVHLGPRPGSTEIARRPGAAPIPAQAFAAEPKRNATGNPLALQGRIVARGAPGRVRAATAPARPAAAASLVSRGQARIRAAAKAAPKMEPVRAKAKARLAPAKKDKARKAESRS